MTNVQRGRGLLCRLMLVSLGLFLLSSCAGDQPPVTVSVSGFGTTPEGKSVSEFTLSNNQGMTVRILNYGGIIRSITVPDAKGNRADVVLGYDTLGEYVRDENYFGALIGRYGNRIADGRFELGGRVYQLERNNNDNHLHSGSTGFHKQVWRAEPFTTAESAGVKLHLISPDGRGGYPGTLTTTAVYELKANNELHLTLEATTDKATPVSLTNHAYFNLAGKDSITRHRLHLWAEHFTPVDDELIPTGETRPVTGTPFDFTQPKAIGRDIGADHQQLAYGRGYDHNWVLSKERPDTVHVAAVLTDPASGRELTLLTDSPGLQFYSGNFLDGSTKGKQGAAYEHRTALCLEPQFFPDSPNQPGFPDTILRPGETYTQHVIYRFSTRS